MTTGWSELGPDFLSTGEWAVGQGPDAPDRLLLRALLRAVDDGSRLRTMLEVGFGSCIDFRELNAANLILPSPQSRILYDGYDATPELVAAAQAAWPGTNFRVQDVLEMDDESAFDVVYARHVLEHVEDGERALQRLWASCRGVLVLSWFIRPSFAPHEVGCVEGDGFPHWTYDATKWINLASKCGAHLHRIDFDHHATRASVWLLSREPQPELVAVMDGFAQTEEFLAALLPVPTPVNEPYESALDILSDTHTALNNVIDLAARVPDLEYVVRESLAAHTRSEAFMFPSQDEPTTTDEIRFVRDAKARCEAVLPVEGTDRNRDVQDVRDAARVVETRLREAGRL